MSLADLHAAEAEALLAEIRSWCLLPAGPLPPGCAPIDDPEQAQLMSFSGDWLLLCGEQMDDQRLRLRNMLEAGCDRQEAMLVGRVCEDFGDRAEAAIDQLLALTPPPLQAWRQQIAVHAQNAIGLRLLRGVRPESFSEALQRCYAAGHLPCGYRGDWPDGQLLVLASDRMLSVGPAVLRLKSGSEMGEKR